MVNSLHQESLIKVKAFLAQNSMKYTFSKSFPLITVSVEFLFRLVDRIPAISTIISFISVRDGVRSWVEWVGSPRGTDARWEGGKTVAHGSFFKPLLSTECGYILVFANFFFLTRTRKYHINIFYAVTWPHTDIHTCCWKKLHKAVFPSYPTWCTPSFSILSCFINRIKDTSSWLVFDFTTGILSTYSTSPPLPFPSLCWVFHLLAHCSVTVWQIGL